MTRSGARASSGSAPAQAAGAGPVIETGELTRRFGDLVAVNEVSLTVRPAEVFGLLGHNGAGKTTLIRLLNGVLAPNAGSARVLGLDPQSQGPELRLRTGVLTESAATDDFLSVRETLEVFARLCGLPPTRVREQVGIVVELFGLEHVLDRPGRGLSTGWRRRVALARCLVHDPELVFLDEPTANLDPVGARTVRELVADLAERRGRTIVLCTHNLHEAQELCDRVAILRKGRVQAVGSTGELADRVALAGVLRLEVGPGDGERARGIVERFRGTEVAGTDGSLLVRGVGRQRIPAVVSALAAGGVDLFTVVEETPSLEDVYVALHDGGGA